ncbi:MAG: hypothetical protein ACJ768_11855 [Gaiellaceae bacterium]
MTDNPEDVRGLTEEEFLAWIEMVPAMVTKAMQLPDGLHFEWDRSGQ